LPNPALVVGLSIHGLAVARALARSGVEVHCLSDIEKRPQPTVRTRYAKVHFRKGLNTEALVGHLLEIAEKIGSAGKIVVLPTSDRMSRTIAGAWDRLESRYLLSWAHCSDLVLKLQRKDSLPEYCERAGVRFPRSRVLQQAGDYAAVVADLRFPLVVKPAQPLSSFKAIRVLSADELRQCCELYPGDMPFVVQEWVEGPEPSLYSCTAYLDRGHALFTFTSRKIAASPPGLGQGTVFETVDAPRIASLSQRFLGQLDLSGPVAVEFKRDADGEFWMIEPNVGRTEYCVDLAVQSGYNLPYVEYLHATGRLSELQIPVRSRACAWFDTDKDPKCFLANLSSLRDDAGERRRAIFPFYGHDDWRPLVAAFIRRGGDAIRAAGRLLAAPFAANGRVRT
jgi:predicted ATP-grasp superfamily ATP-dependent carboligase